LTIPESFSKSFRPKGTPVGSKLLKNYLGVEGCKNPSPYLEYTRATHQDLLYLIPIIGKPLPILESLSHCENIAVTILKGG